jgi:glyceraldehyde 3-phosphate dehydrogenase
MSQLLKKRKVSTHPGEQEQESHDVMLQDWQQQEEASDKMVMITSSMYRDNNNIVEVYGRRLTKLSSARVIEEHGFVSEHFGKHIAPKDTYPVLAALHRLGEHSMRYDVGKIASICQENCEAIGAQFGTPSQREAALVAYLRPLVIAKQQLNGHSDFFKVTHGCTLTKSPVLVRKPQDVVLYGFGRIGRLLARMLVEKTGSGCKMLLRAIVVRQKLDPKLDLEKRASLLKNGKVEQ